MNGNQVVHAFTSNSCKGARGSEGMSSNTLHRVSYAGGVIHTDKS